MNDCGFRALRLDRTAAIEQVIFRIQLGDQTVIRMIRFEVITETGNENPTIVDLINYLREHYLHRQGMLWYHPDGVGTLVALAHIFGIELRIFMNQPDGTTRRILLYMPENNTGEIINFLHIHHHFELLEIPQQNPQNLLGQLAQLTRWRVAAPESVRIERSSRKRLYLGDTRNPLLSDFLPQERPRLTVVFDLDETLIYNRNGPAVMRPYARYLLEQLQNLDIEIILWTASGEETALEALQTVCIPSRLFDDFIFRHDRWFQEPHYVKDLRLLGRDMNRVMIVDNSATACRINQGSSVLVEDFLGNLNIADYTLRNVLEIINHIHETISDQHNVPRLIENLATQRMHLTDIHYELPEKWKTLSAEEMNKIMPHAIPPRGRYFIAANTDIQELPR